MECSTIKCPVLVVLAIFCLVSYSSCMESMCTKFRYEEHLLEKMVRLEFYVENTVNTLDKSISNSVEELTADIGNIKTNITGVIQDFQLKHEEWKEKVERQMSAILDETKAEINEAEKSLKAEIQTFQATVTKSLTEMNETTPLIAFNVYHATSLSPGSSKPVVFKTVLLNEGGGYSPTTGYFTATVSGVYQFNAQLCIDKSKDFEYAITVNGAHIAQGEYRAASDSGDGKCTSFSAIGIVRQGQKAEVRGWLAPLFENTNDWNSFSGVLIKRI